MIDANIYFTVGTTFEWAFLGSAIYNYLIVAENIYSACAKLEPPKFSEDCGYILP